MTLDNDDDAHFTMDEKPRRLVVGYIDRQNTDRRIPPAFHTWLVQYLKHHSAVDLRHVHMEDYTAAVQVQMASTWDMMVGVHGNGLSHQVWMPPDSSFVLEMYWDVPFKYSYPLAAQLWNHTYMGMYNGRVLDSKRIQQRDPLLAADCCPLVYPPQEQHWDMAASQQAVQDFVHQALQERGITIE
jgi:protein O-GlcNAc transferase